MIEQNGMPELKPNSHAAKKPPSKKEPEKKIEKVVKGKVTTRKPKASKKFFSKIFSNEDVINVKDYIVGDVVVPAIKDIIADTVTNAINMILYGETKGRRSYYKGGASYKSYSKYFESPYSHRPTRKKPISNADPFDLDEIILEDYADADDALTEMCELIDTYGNASVADLYDILGLDCPWTWRDYGWEALGKAEAIRLPDGNYILDLPRPRKLVKK